MTRISQNLTLAECVCECGCGFNEVNPRLAVVFELIRHFLGDLPLSPASVCRCEEHNEVVQKQANKNYVAYSSRSKHMYGTAMDIRTDNPRLLYEFLDELFPHTFGIGLYSWGVHIDVRNDRARW